MNWLQQPGTGPLIHGLVSVFFAVLPVAVGYIADPSNPFGISVPVAGLLVTVSNAAVSYYRNSGIAVTTADRVVPNGDIVEIHTRTAPAGPPPLPPAGPAAPQA